MGLYDSVMAPCPKCGHPVEFQTKAGACEMEIYEVATAPAELLFDVMNEPRHCCRCGNWFALVDPAHPPGQPLKPPTLTAANVKPPENPEESGRYKWWPWDRGFTYADLIEPPLS